MSNIRPLGSHVLIQPDEVEEVTAGGIIRAGKKTPNTGKILAVSDDHTFEVSVGDRVQYLPNGRVENEDGTCLIKEDNILFVFN